jgi:DNA-binding NarL/FixJ family response regulator
MVNILLLDDHNVVRNGIKLLLETSSNFKIIAEATTAKDAMKLLKEFVGAVIVLCEVDYITSGNYSFFHEINELNRPIKVVILTTQSHDKYVLNAFKKEIDGYLLKSISTAELFFALNFINDGFTYLCAEITNNIVKKLLLYHSSSDFAQLSSSLTTRETEVLKHITDGLTNCEIAELLFISKRTVEGHRQNLIEKTKVKNTASLVRFALQNGLV